MKNDKVLIAGIIGALSTIPSEIVSQILVSLGYAPYSNFDLSSLIITGTRPSLIMGLFVSSVVGGLIGVLLYLAFIKLGSEHLIIKSIATSILMWVALEFVFTILIEGKLIPVRPISGYYSHLFSAIIYGILMEYCLINFYFINLSIMT